MRRLPVLLLAAALTAPVTTALPTVAFSTARPHPVAPSVAEVGAAGVDPQALAQDGGAAAPVAQAAGAQADAVGPLVGLTLRVLEVARGTDGARTVVLTPARRTASFSTVGVTWDRPAGQGQPDLVVLARTHDTHGWTGWTALSVEEADVTDAGSRAPQRYGTEAVWVGPSDGVQVRIDLRTGRLPTGVRAELVNPGDSDYDAQVGATPPGTAAAQANTPTIYSRAQWGADEGRVRSDATYMPDIAAAVIHHTTDTNNYSAAQVPAIIRADYAYHLSRGWNDIGYNFLVDRFGRIWEGRRGGIAAAVQGAHAGGFNYRTFGISLIGNYETATPSAAAVGAIERLIAWRLDLAHIDPLGTATLTAASFASSRWRAGTTVRLPTIMGHRDVDYTACPGAKLFRLMNQIRSDVARLMGAAVTGPSITPSSGAVGAGGPTVTAGALTRQAWRLSVTDCFNRPVAVDSGLLPGRGSLRAGWNQRLDGGPARPGAYGLRLDSWLGGDVARPVTGTYTVLAPPPDPMPTGTVASGDGGVETITPVRLLDSRSGPVLATGPYGRVDVAVAGQGGIPADAVAVALSVTSVCPTAGTYLTVWPAGRPRPATSTISLPARAIRTATVVVPVGAQGKVSIGNTFGIADVVVDAVGYVATGSQNHVLPIATMRAFDSTVTGGRLPSGATRTVALPALGGVAADRITAVVAQVTVGGASAGGWLGARPGDGLRAGTTLTSYGPGDSSVTLGMLGVDHGRLTLTNQGSPVDVAIDVVAVVTTDAVATVRLHALSPVRAYDSRTSGGTPTAGAPRTFVVASDATGVPAGATSVLVNFTVVAGATATSVTAWDGGTRPNREDLRVGAGQTRANLALVPIGPGGVIAVSASAGASALVADVVGYAK